MISNLEQLQVIWFTISNLKSRVKFILVILTLPHWLRAITSTLYRNNAVLNLLSAPNYGLSPTPRQCLLWETALANAVIDNMKNHDDVYIPPNMVKCILPMFHIDNIDWHEDTPDGKNTSQIQ